MGRATSYDRSGHRPPTEIEQLLERIEEVYAGLSHRQLRVDLATPDPLEARLALDGWKLNPTLQHLLVGDLPDLGKPTPGFDIDPVGDDHDWDDMYTRDPPRPHRGGRQGRS